MLRNFRLWLAGMSAVLLALLALPPALYAQDASQSDRPSEYYFQIDTLNPGLAPLPDQPGLDTPQAALEHLLTEIEADDPYAAAHALNLNALPIEEQTVHADQLARQLHYVLNHKSLLSWDKLPDRPDGQLDIGLSNNDPLAGEPRRSITLGSLPLDGRELRIRVNRVRAGDNEPVWVFASSTVENIPALYERHGPSWLEQRLPAWARLQTFGVVPLWEWGGLILMLLLSIGSGWIISHSTGFVLRRIHGRRLNEIAHILRGPLTLLASTVVLYVLNATLLTLSGVIDRIVTPITGVLGIVALTWLGMKVINFITEYISRRLIYEQYDQYDLRARRMLTSLSVSRQALVFLALLIGIGFALSQFRGFETLGWSLLASAGVLSVIIGVAARTVLSNMLAGIQLASTQPVRINDNVYFEGDWGYVEDITYTFITIRTWDQRRVVVPLDYLISHPIENWSRTDKHLIKPVHLYADYTVDVEAIRQKFKELLRADEDWDERSEAVLHVTNLTEETVELRALCSAADPMKAWYLHTRMREQLLNFLRELEDGRYLPRRRLVFTDKTEPAPASRPPEHDLQPFADGRRDGENWENGEEH